VITTILIALLLVAQQAQGQPSPTAGDYAAARTGSTYMQNYYLPPAPSSTPWAPAWAPDGKTIAVAMMGSIWRVDPASGTATEITYGKRYHSAPAWSPDGKWIVYTADDNHKRIQLEILNVNTGETAELTGDESVYADPVFSRDGRQLAYVSTRPNGYFNVYVRAIENGRWTGNEMAVTTDHKYPRDRLYVGAADMHIEPAWLPNGKELLIISNRGVPQGSGAIWRVPVEPNGMERAKKILDEQSLFRTRPDVSIDGKRFIYSSTAGGADQFHHLYVLPVDGGYPYKMTFGEHEDFHPRWSPDGEHIAFISNQGGLPRLVVMETYGGGRKTVTLGQLNWKRAMGTLSVRVVDQDTNRPIHARIQGVSADGKFYPPRNAYSRRTSVGDLFHTDGTYEVTVPPGKTSIDAVHGFEYWPKQTSVEITPGKKQEVTISLKRMVDMNAKGWYSGSTHTHMNYGGNLRNTLENLMFMAKAEDEDVVNELVANKENRVMDWQYFVPGGGEHPVSKGDPAVRILVGEEYRPPFYGHVFLLGLKDHLISPFLTGYEGTGIDSLYPSNTDIFRKAIAQGALTGYVHAFSTERDPLAGDLGVAKAFPVDAALGTVSCLEWSSASRTQLEVWHRALNNDLRVTPTGGEDSISNLHIGKLVGAVRTYAYLGSEFSVNAWLTALRNGNTFFTTGPLLEFKIGGKLPGGKLRFPQGGAEVSAEASARSITRLSKVVIYRNGQIWRELPLSSDGLSATWHGTILANDSGWYSLYAEGPRSSFLDAVFAQAVTNAIRVYIGDKTIRNRESAEYFVRWIDKLQRMAEAWPWWRSEQEKQHVFEQFGQARAVYVRLAKEASR
jgi:TolB protein